jgi:hypothetical protein
MKKIKFLTFSALVVLPFIASEIAYGMDGPSLVEEQKRGAGIQLTKGPDHTLETPIGLQTIICGLITYNQTDDQHLGIC